MMKKFKFFAFVAILVGLVACNKDSEATLLNRIPADADVAAVINVKKLVKSAGGDLSGCNLNLPEYIVKRDSAGCTEFVQKLATSGLDVENLGVWLKDSEGYLVVEVKDADKLSSFLSQEKFHARGNNGGYEFYAFDDADAKPSYCAVGDGYAYFYDHSGSFDRVSKSLSEAVSKPMGSTAFGRYASEGNAGGVIVDARTFLNYMGKDVMLPIAVQASGRFCVKVDVDSDEASATSVLLNDKGEKVSVESMGLKFDTSATISAEALAYLAPSECLVYAFALKNVDWDSLVDSSTKSMGLNPMQTMVAGMAKEYLKKIDGTVAIGIGFDGGKSDIEKLNAGSGLNYVPFTIVVQTAPGKAKGLLGDISALLATFGMNPSQLPDGFSAHISDDGTMLYGKAEGNTLVLSSRPIERYNNNGATAGMTGNIAAFGLWLPADYPLIRDFGVVDNLLVEGGADMKDSEGELDIKITGATAGGFVERLIKLATAYQAGFNDIESQMAVESNFTPEEPASDADYFDGFEPTYF